ATSRVGRLYPEGTGNALGWVGVGASVGLFGGRVYEGWEAGPLERVVDAVAWRRPVFEVGLLGVLATVAFFWLAHNEQPVPRREQKAEHGANLFPTGALYFFFLLTAFAFSLRDFVGTSMGSLGSLFLQNAHGYGPRWTG